MKKSIYILLIILTQSLYSQVRYEVPCEYNVIHRAVSIAHKQVGLKELTGNNDGEHIREYMKAVGLNYDKHYPYCAAGIVWCMLTAADELDKDICIKKSALCYRLFTWAKASGKITYNKPHVGDIVIWNRAGTTKGHTEIIIEVLKNGWVTTIGFNTSNGKRGSQREGNGIFIRKRNLFHMLGNMYIKCIIGFPHGKKTTTERLIPKQPVSARCL